jgi:hypothetical protein
MSDLEAGQYWIQNAASPKPWIGVIGSEVARGVVTEGRLNIVSSLVFVFLSCMME